MFYLKYVLLGILPFVSVATVESKAVHQLPALPEPLHHEPSADQLDILTNIVGYNLKDTGYDVTVVASQNVYNPDGTFKEIRTIELIIPNRFKDMRPMYETDDYIDLLREDNKDYGDNFAKIQKFFKLVHERDHFKLETAYLRNYPDKRIETEIYLSNDEAYYQTEDGMAYYLRDGIQSKDKKKLEAELKKRFENKDDAMISVLVWDQDHKFITDESKVEPMLLAYVDKASDTADEKMMDTAVRELSMYVPSGEKKIAKALSAAMSKDFPDYTWFATNSDKEMLDNAQHDVYIKMTYDNVPIGENLLKYTVYGVKK